MSKFLFLGAFSITPLVIISPYYLGSNNFNIWRNPDESIILVSVADGDFSGTCEQYSGGAIGGGHQQAFNNSDDLLNHLFSGINKFPENSLKVSIMLAPEIIQSREQEFRQPLTIRRSLESDRKIPQTFKEYWDLWISDWSPRAIGVKKVVYTDKRFGEQQRENNSKIENLYKCHKGISWYSLKLEFDFSQESSLPKRN